jgi:hypothetical protein
MLPCSWKENFGVECPSCGAQRSFFELISGDIWASIQLFPALVPLILAIISAVLHLIFPKRIPVKWTVFLFILTGFLMLASWMYKLITTYG